MDNSWFSEQWLSNYASLGLLLFFLFFMGVILWVVTRPRKQTDRWASIPLSDDKPVDDRLKNNSTTES